MFERVESVSQARYLKIHVEIHMATLIKTLKHVLKSFLCSVKYISMCLRFGSPGRPIEINERDVFHLYAPDLHLATRKPQAFIYHEQNHSESDTLRDI